MNVVQKIKCEKCETQNRSNAKHCKKCGNKLSNPVVEEFKQRAIKIFDFVLNLSAIFFFMLALASLDELVLSLISFIFGFLLFKPTSNYLTEKFKIKKLLKNIVILCLSFFFIFLIIFAFVGENYSSIKEKNLVKELSAQNTVKQFLELKNYDDLSQKMNNQEKSLELTKNFLLEHNSYIIEQDKLLLKKYKDFLNDCEIIIVKYEITDFSCENMLDEFEKSHSLKVKIENIHLIEEKNNYSQVDVIFNISDEFGSEIVERKYLLDKVDKWVIKSSLDIDNKTFLERYNRTIYELRYESKNRLVDEIYKIINENFIENKKQKDAVHILSEKVNIELAQFLEVHNTEFVWNANKHNYSLEIYYEFNANNKETDYLQANLESEELINKISRLNKEIKNITIKAIKGPYTNLKSGKVIAETFYENKKINFEFKESYNPYMRKFVLDGKDRWLDTGIMLKEGDRFIIKSYGNIIWDTNTGQSSSPEGITTLTSNNDFLCRGGTPMAFVLKNGEKCQFVKSYSLFEHIGPQAYLKLGFNDYLFDDNEGKFNVALELLNETTEKGLFNEVYSIENKFKFNKSTPEISLAYDSIAEPFSISVWVKTNDSDYMWDQTNKGYIKPTSYNNFVLFPGSNEPSENYYLGFSMGKNGVIIFEHEVNSYLAPLLVYKKEIDLDWNNIIITRSEGISNLYVNGNFVKRGLKSNYNIYSPQILGSPVYKPSIYGPHDFGDFNGEVQKLKITRSILSEEEVKEIYNTEKDKLIK